ncbi:hypothetical protein CBR_g18619 [Chara braunii]|uniref:ABC transporter domain-containing protein n=1 Tax=Chara braunii TaxID=69332 RepID=A0A388JT85_CHABU|nr:hypothetical protein CBR_g18619 [Chara braunii]|eukprot:GBG61024.1 hypothetical protein CBR_g18619 [Chara braunii]
MASSEPCVSLDDFLSTRSPRSGIVGNSKIDSAAGTAGGCQVSSGAGAAATARVMECAHVRSGQSQASRSGSMRRARMAADLRAASTNSARFRIWRALLFFLACGFLGVACGDDAGVRSWCILRFDIVEEESLFRRVVVPDVDTWHSQSDSDGREDGSSSPLQMQGALFMVLDLPGGGRRCPSSIELARKRELLRYARFHSLPLTSTDDVRGVSMRSLLPGSAGGVNVDLGMKDIALSLDTGPISDAAIVSDFDDNGMRESVTFNVKQGWSVVREQFSGSAAMRYSDTIFGSSAMATSINVSGLIQFQEQLLTLEVPKVAMRFPLRTGHAVDVSWEGRLVARARLGCEAECNLHGRCEGFVKAPQMSPCECDCGWAGPTCSERVSQQREESYPGIVSEIQLARNVDPLVDEVKQVQVSIPRLRSWTRGLGAFPVQVSVGGVLCNRFAILSLNSIWCALPGGVVSEENRVTVVIRWGCKKSQASSSHRSAVQAFAQQGLMQKGSARSLLSTFNSPPVVSNFEKCFGTNVEACPGVGNYTQVLDNCTCACLESWAGKKCDVCRTDQACQSTGKGALCSNSTVYTNSTKYKRYSCTLTPGPASEFVRENVDIFCNKSESFCKINMQLKDGGDLECSSPACGMKDGASDFDCVNVNCTCNKGQCDDIFTTLTKKVGMSCNGQTCTFKVGAIPIVAQCEIGECVSSSDALVLPKGDDKTMSVLGSVMVSLAILLSLFAIFLFCGWRLWQRKEGEARYLAWAKPTEETRLNNGMRSELEGGPGQVLSVHNLAVKEVGAGTFSVLKRSAKGLWRLWKAKKLGAEEVSTVSNDGIKLSIKKDKRTYILSDLSFTVSRGSVLAIMGPTGSGKTTLLNVIAGVGGGRAAGTEVYGSIEVDGKRRGPGFRRYAALLPQEDFLFNTLTVEECIWYSAQLRLPAFMPDEVKVARVNMVIEDLGLTKVRKHRVGTSFTEPGLSGGERRRVRIAMELVCDPKIIFLDEPTSGLDSHTSLLLVRKLNEIAQRGAIVVLNVHQPSEEAFNEFDKVLLLSKAGRIVFYGPRVELAPFFSAIGYPCPSHRNFADHMLEVISLHEEFNDPMWPGHERALLVRAMQQRGDGQREQTTRPNTDDGSGTHLTAVSGLPSRPMSNHMHNLAEPPYFNRSPSPSSDQRLLGGSDMLGKTSAGDATDTGLPSAEANKLDYHHSLQEADDDDSWGNGKPDSNWLMTAYYHIFPREPKFLQGPEFERSIITEMWVVFWRELMNTWRHPSLLALHLAVALVLGMLVGAVFYHVQNTFPGVQNRAGAFYFSVTLFAFTSLSALELFITERVIFIQEASSYYYRTFSYFFAKIMVDAVLLRVVPSVLYGLIVYNMMGLDTGDGKLGVFLATLMLLGIVTGALCSLLSLLVSTVSVANVISVVITLMFFLFGGLLLNTSGTNASKGTKRLSWLPKISYFSYSWEIMMLNELKGLKINFTAPDLVENLELESEVILKMLGVSTDLSTIRWNFGALVIMCIVYYGLAYVVLFIRVAFATRFGCKRIRGSY